MNINYKLFVNKINKLYLFINTIYIDKEDLVIIH